ncbi:hypothetical protein DFH09DRAFT_1079650 [Mycena vulgaris]|nr:hypothetical protein DFH09DRAFT_1079650 [Mycena vulgaris]
MHQGLFLPWALRQRRDETQLVRASTLLAFQSLTRSSQFEHVHKKETGPRACRCRESSPPCAVHHARFLLSISAALHVSESQDSRPDLDRDVEGQKDRDTSESLTAHSSWDIHSLADIQPAKRASNMRTGREKATGSNTMRVLGVEPSSAPRTTPSPLLYSLTHRYQGAGHRAVLAKCLGIRAVNDFKIPRRISKQPERDTPSRRESNATA